MRRRDFLKTTSAAAAVVAGTATARPSAAEDETERQLAAPAIGSGGRRLRLAIEAGFDFPGNGAERLAQRIKTATEGRYRIEAADPAEAMELTYGAATPATNSHPAFAFFTGLPRSQGMDASLHRAWLAVGGGQMLWDELAAGVEVKPLVIGHTGPSVGLWAARRLDSVADFAGLRLAADPDAGEVVRALGGQPIDVPPGETQEALADGRLQGVERPGPFAALSPDLQPLAERLYTPGLSPHGKVLSLGIARRVWMEMGAADRAIFEACAAEEYGWSLADARVHAAIAHEVAEPTKWPVRHAFSPEIYRALDAAAKDVVERIAATDAQSQRIFDSYRAFRAFMGIGAIA